MAVGCAARGRPEKHKCGHGKLPPLTEKRKTGRQAELLAFGGGVCVYPAKAGVAPAQVALMPAIRVGAVLLVWGSSGEAIGYCWGRHPTLVGVRPGKRQGM